MQGEWTSMQTACPFKLSLYEERELRMGTTESLTATEPKMEQVTTDKLKEDLRTVKADMEELLKATASQAGERIAAARVKAGESLRLAKARLAEAQAVVVAKTKVGVKITDDYVRANPWNAVGIAVAFGFVLGTLLARRN